MPKKDYCNYFFKKKKDMTRNLDETFISANDQWDKQKSFIEEEHCLSLIVWEMKQSIPVLWIYFSCNSLCF